MLLLTCGIVGTTARCPRSVRLPAMDRLKTSRADDFSTLRSLTLKERCDKIHIGWEASLKVLKSNQEAAYQLTLQKLNAQHQELMSNIVQQEPVPPTLDINDLNYTSLFDAMLEQQHGTLTHVVGIKHWNVTVASEEGAHLDQIVLTAGTKVISVSTNEEKLAYEKRMNQHYDYEQWLSNKNKNTCNKNNTEKKKNNGESDTRSDGDGDNNADENRYRHIVFPVKGYGEQSYSFLKVHQIGKIWKEEIVSIPYLNEL